MEQTIGTINLTTGKVTVTDPCYDKGTWCSAELENVHKGEWEVIIDRVSCSFWGNRVACLKLHVVGENITEYRERVNADIGGDAGVCGVFEDKPNYGTSRWGSVCDEMKGFAGIAKKENAFGCVGAWSNSGFGDGSYDLYVARNDDGEIIGIYIDYGVEGEPDEE